MIYWPRPTKLYWLQKRFEWWRRQPPQPITYKAALLIAHQVETGVRVFVETGTAMGETTEAVAPYFGAVYTVEVNPETFRNVRSRLQCFRHVNCVLGDSAAVFSSWLLSLNEPAIVWLDAHLDESVPIERSPLLSELDALLSCGQPHHIFIDDARLYHNREWFLRWLDRMAERHYQSTLRHDVYRVIPQNSVNKSPQV